MSRFSWRDLVLLVLGAFAGSILPIVAAHGVNGVTVADLEHAASAAAVGFLTWLVAYCTPITRQYGVGAGPPVDTVDTSPPEPITALATPDSPII